MLTIDPRGRVTAAAVRSLTWAGKAGATRVGRRVTPTHSGRTSNNSG